MVDAAGDAVTVALHAGGLDADAAELIRGVLVRHPSITRAVLFGSRAKGCATERSDVDLCVDGLADELAAESLAHELEELPLPYRFDVAAEQCIRHAPLREHIARVGMVIYERSHDVG